MIRLKNGGGGGGWSGDLGKRLRLGAINEFPKVMIDEEGFELSKPDEVICICEFKKLGGVWAGEEKR